MIRHLAVLFTITVAGCSTHLVPMSETKPVPQEHILSTAYAQHGTDRQEIRVVRNAGALTAGGGRVHLSVDGKLVADLATSEVFILYLPNGQHLLTAVVEGSSSNLPASTLVQIPTNFVIYRIDMDEGGPKLQPSAE